MKKGDDNKSIEEQNAFKNLLKHLALQKLLKQETLVPKKFVCEHSSELKDMG